MFISEAYAQAAGGQAGGGLESLSQFLPIILIFGVIYFLLIRPQQQKVKAHKEMVSQIRRGDRVLTQGGILGQINKVISDTEVSVEIAEGVKVRVMRSAIAEVLAKTEPVAGKDAKDAKDDSGAEETAAPAVQPEPGESKPANPLARFFGKK